MAVAGTVRLIAGLLDKLQLAPYFYPPKTQLSLPKNKIPSFKNESGLFQKNLA